MKRIKILCAGFILGACAVLHAQKINHPLVGVWQQLALQKTEGDKLFYSQVPVWKVYQQDGAYSVFMIASQSGFSIKTAEGTYTIDNDSTYTEFIRDSGANPDIQGKNNALKYSIAQNKILTVRYTLPGRTQEASEVWTRVDFLPKQK